MRITIIGPAYPLRGGIAHHVYYLKRQLTARGHTVQVISFRKLYPTLFFPGTTESDTSTLRLDAAGIPLLSSLNPLTWVKAIKAVKAFSPDLVVIQWWQPFFALMIGTLVRAFRRSRLKCVLECHNVFPHEGSPFDKLLLKYAAAPVHSFITHSSKDQSDLASVVSGKAIRVAPLPVPNELLRKTHVTRGGRNILFFGKVRKYKGLDILLAAMPRVLSEVDCKLLVVGEFYDAIEKYQELINRLGIQEHVTIDNRYVPNEEIAEVFDRADVLVLPYLSATQSAVARIALANGLPVIASRSGGLVEVVIDNVNGLLFPVGDVDALAERITQYFSGHRGAEFSENLLRLAQTEKPDLLAQLIENEFHDQQSTPADDQPLHTDNSAQSAPRITISHQ